MLAAGRKSMPQADVALEELRRTYWFPLYAYVRRQGQSKEDAVDRGATCPLNSRAASAAFCESSTSPRT